MRDWSNYKYGLNVALVNPPVKPGDAAEFLQLLSAGAFMGGVDFRTVSCVGSFVLNVGVSWA